MIFVNLIPNVGFREYWIKQREKVVSRDNNFLRILELEKTIGFYACVLSKLLIYMCEWLSLKVAKFKVVHPLSYETSQDLNLRAEIFLCSCEQRRFKW